MKTMVALLPLWYVVLLGISLLNEFIYYYFFDINIVNFITVSDLATLIFDDAIIFGLIILCLYIIVNTLSIQFAIKINQQTNKVSRAILYLVGFVICIGLVARSYLIFSYWYFIITVIFIAIISILSIVYLLYLFDNLSRNIVFVSLIILVIFYTGLKYAYKKNNIEYGDSRLDSILMKDNSTIEDNAHHLFLLGSTAKYIFLFDKTNNLKIVLNRSEIMSISFTEKRLLELDVPKEILDKFD